MTEIKNQVEEKDKSDFGNLYKNILSKNIEDKTTVPLRWTKLRIQKFSFVCGRRLWDK